MAENDSGEKDGFHRFTIAVSGGIVLVDDGPYMRFEDHQRALYAQTERCAVLLRQAEKNSLAATQEAVRLRDFRRFGAAKAAMQGMLAARETAPATEVATAAVGYADALLAELDRPREEPGSLHEDD